MRVLALDMLLDMAAPSCRCDSPGPDGLRGLSVNGATGSLKALLAAFPNLDPAKVVLAYQDADKNFELAADLLLQAGCQEDSASKPPISSGQAEEENPSLKILVSWLQRTFPSLESDILCQVLEANDYCYRKTVDFLVEGGVKPSEERLQDPASLLTSVMRTLFQPETKISPPPSPPAQINRSNDGNRETWQVVKPRAPRDDIYRNGRLERIEDDEVFDAYKASRRLAASEWSKMNECFQQAAAAYQRGERAYAGILSERGKEYQRLAREASDKASTHLFNVKNKYMDNNITIDLHAQHVTEAMSLLKLHIKSLSPLPSVHTLTIITGHGNGHAKIRPSVIGYLERKGIAWEETNLGRLVVNLQKLRPEADPV